VLTSSGCDDGRGEPGPADAGPVYGIASTAQLVAWEGQPRFVTVLSTETGEALDGATVEVQDPSGPLEIIEQRCAGTRCGVVLRIADETPSTGTAVPAPIDAVRHFLLVRRTDGAPDLRALLNVMPLDAIAGVGSTPREVGGVRFASGLEVGAEASFTGSPGDAPIRWVVFGDATVAGTLDVSADGAAPGPGGYAGGDPGTDGQGPTAGGAGVDGAGGGGGGHAEPGTAGDGPGGEPEAGGAGGPASIRPRCVADFFDVEVCGGSGGGGAEGAGGAGGGVAALVVLGRLELADGTLGARGGDGALGGGGGAGGAWLVAAPEWSAPAELDVSGGAGEGAGGAGGAGLLRVQVPGDAASTGPAVDLSAVPGLTDASTVVLTGTAAPDATVVVEPLAGGEGATTTADAAGAFSVEVPLAEGLNRLRVVQGDGEAARRSWVGTSLELERRGDATLPVGALIDVAYVP
jgi:hypothetical protein